MLTHAYALFLVMRFLIGALQGLFIAAAFMATMAVVPPERIGQAIGIVISGVALPGALGLPLGTLVGQTLGWRGRFAAVVVGAADQARYAFAPRVLAVLFLNFIVSSAVFALLTVTGVSGAMLSVFLLAYGAATASGSFAGGVAINGHSARAAVFTGLVFAVVTIAVAVGTSFLKPPVIGKVAVSGAESVPELA